MHDPISVLENDTYKIPWVFEIQMDHLFSARRPDYESPNKETKKELVLSYSGRPPGYEKRKQKDGKYFNLA